MKGYQAIYVCRLCGERYWEVFTDNKGIAKNTAICTCAGLPSPEPLYPRLIDIHQCKDGSIGIGDFQGYQYKES